MGTVPIWEALTEKQQKSSRDLFAILFSLCGGKAESMVRRGPYSRRRDGLSAWHKMCHSYTPRVGARKVALKQAVFHPKFSPEMGEEAWVRGFDDWLRTIDEAESEEFTTCKEGDKVEVLRELPDHTVVIKREVYEKHPWLALNLFHCFMAAKSEVEHETADTLKDYFDTGLMDPAGASAMKLDPKSYGMKSSRTVVETIARYVHEQGLTDRVVQVEEMFAPSTLEV